MVDQIDVDAVVPSTRLFNARTRRQAACVRSELFALGALGRRQQ